MGETTEISTEEETVENTTNISTGQEDTVKDTSALKLLLNDEEINVRWEDNEAVQALYELAAKESVTISMSMYGGFEQVGSIGTNLPANDEQMTTVPGDIVLYSGNQIVVFYGSNTWPYTKLGHITEKSEQELAELLNNGNVTIRIEAAMESATDNSRVNSFDFEKKTVLLNSGYEMPIMGLGTYSLDYDTCVNSVKALLQNGGRLIDTAYMRSIRIIRNRM